MHCSIDQRHLQIRGAAPVFGDEEKGEVGTGVAGGGGAGMGGGLLCSQKKSNALWPTCTLKLLRQEAG